MGKLQEFLTKNIVDANVTAEVNIKPFPHPFVIKSITQAENSQIRKSCTVTELNRKTHQKESVTDTQAYLNKLIVACTVDPCFKDADLQSAYGVMGAEALLEKILTPGQYAELLQAVNDINCFDNDMQELVDEAKN